MCRRNVVQCFLLRGNVYIRFQKRSFFAIYLSSQKFQVLLFRQRSFKFFFVFDEVEFVKSFFVFQDINPSFFVTDFKGFNKTGSWFGWESFFGDGHGRKAKGISWSDQKLPKEVENRGVQVCYWINLVAMLFGFASIRGKTGCFFTLGGIGLSYGSCNSSSRGERACMKEKVQQHWPHQAFEIS